MPENEPNTPGASPENPADEAAAPRRRRRAASRPAGPPAASSETPAEVVAESTPPAAEEEPKPRRRATRKAAAPAPEAVEAAEVPAEEAKPRRRATRKAAAPAPEAVEAPAEEEPKPRRRATRKVAAPAPEAVEAPAEEEPKPRRRATRKVAAPEPEAVEAAAEEEPKPRRRATRKVAAPAPEAVEAAEVPAEEAKPRRRATRKAAAPAPAPEPTAAPAEVAEPAESAAPPAAAETAEPPAPAEAAPARTRRRATRKASAPAPANEAPAAAPAAPAEPARPAAEEEPPSTGRGSRRRTRQGPPAATFSAGDGLRRLKPGSLADRDAAAAEAAAPAAVESGVFTARAVRDGDGWAVEVEAEDGTTVRGVGGTVADATADAAEALAVASGVPAEAISIEVREETVPARGRRRAVRPAVAVFQPPVFQAPQAGAAGRQETEPEARTDETAETAEAEAAAEPAEGRSVRRRRRRRGAAEQPSVPADEPETESAQDAEAEAEPEEPEEVEADHEDVEDGEERPSRRRRRGGRRRRRGDAQAQEHDESSAEGADEDEEQGENEGDEGADETEEGAGAATSGSRRRRRRRRRGTDGGDHETSADDPERTVVKVREPRASRLEGGTGVDEVQSIKGSTRLEAKKQRRREGREQGRRRVPIITEAEFLARREAVERVMVVRQLGDRTQIGVLEDNVLVEHYVNKEQSTSYVGNVYLGKVQNVLPSMEAAFVDIGKGRNAVLYAGEVNFEALGLSGGPRRIETALKSGQPVLVQVTKDPIGHKGARLTSQVSLPGRYLVYVPEGSMTGISRKLPDTERARLKSILKKVVPEDAGVIVRTAAEGASEDELRRDVERLQAQWQDIQRKAKTGNAPTLLHGEPDMTVRVVRDIFNEDFSKVVVSGDEAWETIHEYVSHVAPDLVDRLSRWTSETDVFATYRIDEQLLKALDRKVWLPSGGSLVIDKTEAMVVVDVNTGKFTGQGGNLEETVTRNNLEAAEEIVRQLRLRDLGGIVVVDFIDMVLESNRDLVMRRLLECLGRDRTKHQVAEVTSLGLVQMTRKRVGQGLLESFSETCVHCNGRGVIVHMDQAAGNGGGGKRKRRRGGAGGEQEPEHVHAAGVETGVPEPEAAEEIVEELPEIEPIEVDETELVPAVVDDVDEEWFGSASEAEAAASRRGRRRGSRKATAPAGAPAPVDHEPEPAVVVVPVSEPETDVVPVAEPEPAVSVEPPARARRRATRKATAPAGAPASAEPAVVVVPVSEPETDVVPVAEPEPAVSVEPPARARRRATRKATAPAGAPASAEAAVVVVEPSPAAAPAAEPEAAGDTEPKKRARKAPAKKAAAKKTAAKKTATKKAATKKAAAQSAE
jgi:ribonuclease E